MDSRQALQELQNFQASRRPAQDYYNQAQQQLGVGAAQQRAQELRGLIRGTEQALRGVEKSVSGRTQGSLVTEAQRSRLANLERQPLGEQFREQQGALSDQDALYQNLLSEAGRRAGFSYQSDADRLGALQQQYQNVLSNEQAAEQRRQFEEQLRFNREQEARLEREGAATRALQAKTGIDLNALIGNRGAFGQVTPERKAAIEKEARKEAFSGYLRQNAQEASQLQKDTQAWSEGLQWKNLLSPIVSSLKGTQADYAVRGGQELYNRIFR